VTDTHLPVQFAWPTGYSTPFYEPIMPKLDTQLVADSTGGQTGEVDWTLTIDNFALLGPLGPTPPPNLNMPVTFSFSVGVGNSGATTTQPILFTETVITGGADGGPISGTARSDIMIAVGGNNQLITNGGSDLLTGYGNDTFVVNSFLGRPTITNFGSQDAIDLTNILYTDTDHTTLAFAENAGNTAGTLTVSDGAHVNNIVLMGSYTVSDFVMADDGHGGTLVTDPHAPNTSHVLAPHP
jgi:hypothetical protein